jgi:hypothetical protein
VITTYASLYYRTAFQDVLGQDSRQELLDALHAKPSQAWLEARSFSDPVPRVTGRWVRARSMVGCREPQDSMPPCWQNSWWTTATIVESREVVRAT